MSTERRNSEQEVYNDLVAPETGPHSLPQNSSETTPNQLTRREFLALLSGASANMVLFPPSAFDVAKRIALPDSTPNPEQETRSYQFARQELTPIENEELSEGILDYVRQGRALLTTEEFESIGSEDNEEKLRILEEVQNQRDRVVDFIDPDEYETVIQLIYTNENLYVRAAHYASNTIDDFYQRTLHPNSLILVEETYTDALIDDDPENANIDRSHVFVMPVQTPDDPHLTGMAIKLRYVSEEIGYVPESFLGDDGNGHDRATPYTEIPFIQATPNNQQNLNIRNENGGHEGVLRPGESVKVLGLNTRQLPGMGDHRFLPVELENGDVHYIVASSLDLTFAANENFVAYLQQTANTMDQAPGSIQMSVASASISTRLQPTEAAIVLAANDRPPSAEQSVESSTETLSIPLSQVVLNYQQSDPSFIPLGRHLSSDQAPRAERVNDILAPARRREGHVVQGFHSGIMIPNEDGLLFSQDNQGLIYITVGYPSESQDTQKHLTITNFERVYVGNTHRGDEISMNGRHFNLSDAEQAFRILESQNAYLQISFMAFENEITQYNLSMAGGIHNTPIEGTSAHGLLVGSFSFSASHLRAVFWE